MTIRGPVREPRRVRGRGPAILRRADRLCRAGCKTSLRSCARLEQRAVESADRRHCTDVSGVRTACSPPKRRRARGYRRRVAHALKDPRPRLRACAALNDRRDAHGGTTRARPAPRRGRGRRDASPQPRLPGRRRLRKRSEAHRAAHGPGVSEPRNHRARSSESAR